MWHENPWPLPARSPLTVAILDPLRECNPQWRDEIDYQAANGVPIGQFGGRFLVRGGRQEVVEGKQRSRTAVLEFPSYEVALSCYRSPGYQAAKALRLGKAEVDLIIIEGVEDGH